MAITKPSVGTIVTETLQWRHNERDGISNHQPHDCLLKSLFRRRSEKTSNLHVTGLCEGNSPETGEFPAQRASWVTRKVFPFDDVFMRVSLQGFPRYHGKWKCHYKVCDHRTIHEHNRNGIWYMYMCMCVQVHYTLVGWLYCDLYIALSCLCWYLNVWVKCANII